MENENPERIFHDRRAALVLDGSVVNVIIVFEDQNGVVDFELPGHQIVVLPDDSPVGHGWTYVDGQFVEPPTEEPQELPLSQ